jgi:hypothetical protein
MKNCCEKFKLYSDGQNESSPNIRIVKFLPNLHQKKHYFRFFITHGYEKFNMDVIFMNIAYCPFCGKNLFDFYKEDTIPNEIEGTTFPKIF